MIRELRKTINSKAPAATRIELYQKRLDTIQRIVQESKETIVQAEERITSLTGEQEELESTVAQLKESLKPPPTPKSEVKTPPPAMAAKFEHALEQAQLPAEARKNLLAMFALAFTEASPGTDSAPGSAASPGLSTPTRANPRTATTPPSIRREAAGAPWAGGGDPWEVSRASNQGDWNQQRNGGTAWHSLSPTQPQPRQWHSQPAEADPYTTAVAPDDMEEEDDTELQGAMEEALQTQPLDDLEVGSQSDFQEAENEEGGGEPSVVTTRKGLAAVLGTLAPGSTSGEVRNASLKDKRQATGAFGRSKATKKGASS